jgi:cytochrome b561
VTTTTTSRTLLPWTGLLVGPLAWAVSFQGNFVLAAWQCTHSLRPVPFVAIGLAIAALAGGFVSWRSWQPVAGEPEGSHRLRRFIAALSTLLAILFTLAILLQAFAGVVFTGCER